MRVLSCLKGTALITLRAQGNRGSYWVELEGCRVWKFPTAGSFHLRHSKEEEVQLVLLLWNGCRSKKRSLLYFGDRTREEPLLGRTTFYFETVNLIAGAFMTGRTGNHDRKTVVSRLSKSHAQSKRAMIIFPSDDGYKNSQTSKQHSIAN